MIETFSDGNMADVIRVGNVVRKQRGVWWEATRQVLTHLEFVQYPWSPRVVAESDDTVELTYMAGKTIPASLEGAEEESLLRLMGKRIRALHDALGGFHFQPGTECVPWPVAPEAGTLLCHNDLSPWNTVMNEGKFQGFIDWDLVSYGTPEWELAWACWRWAPIYPYGDRIAFNAQQQIDRCRTLLKAYGVDSLNLTGFVDLIDQRMECAVEVVEQLGAQGIPGFDRLLATGMHLSGHDDRIWLAQHRDAFRAGIESL